MQGFDYNMQFTNLCKALINLPFIFLSIAKNLTLVVQAHCIIGLSFNNTFVFFNTFIITFDNNLIYMYRLRFYEKDSSLGKGKKQCLFQSLNLVKVKK